MPAPTQTIMKANIKTALLSKIDPSTGHPLYCAKAIDNNGNIVYDDLNLMPAMEDIIGYISQGITTTWATWQASQTVIAGVQVNTVSGTGTTIPTAGNLP